MSKRHVRNLVLGAGAVGSAAARHLARRGESVLLLEQFRVGHARGSSHGLARIARHSYADEPHARRMIDAFRGWRELEAEAGETLFVKTGGLSLASEGVDYVDRVAASLAAIDVPYRQFSGRELRRRLPVFRVPDTTEAVFEPDAGLLRASRIVALQVELAQASGAAVLEEVRVERIDLEGDKPVVLASGERIVADRLIVAAGAWAGRLLPGLGHRLVPTRQQVLYFAHEEPTSFAIGRFPIWIFMGDTPEHAYYGMPEFLGGGVKAARHSGPTTDPDLVGEGVGETYVDEIRGFLAGILPSLAASPLRKSEVCLYTMTADEQFAVGPWSGRTDVLLASPCSGHGFKFSNAIGELLADLATGEGSARSLPEWASDRASLVDLA